MTLEKPNDKSSEQFGAVTHLTKFSAVDFETLYWNLASVLFLYYQGLIF